MRCMLDKMGLFDDASGFHVDHMVKQLSGGEIDSEIKSAVDECVGENPHDINACTRAFLAVQCLRGDNLELINFR